MLVSEDSVASILTTQPGDDNLAEWLEYLGFGRTHTGYLPNSENAYETYAFWSGQLVGRRITYGFRNINANPISASQGTPAM